MAKGSNNTNHNRNTKNGNQCTSCRWKGNRKKKDDDALHVNSTILRCLICNEKYKNVIYILEKKNQQLENRIASLEQQLTEADENIFQLREALDIVTQRNNEENENESSLSSKRLSSGYIIPFLASAKGDAKNSHVVGRDQIIADDANTSVGASAGTSTSSSAFTIGTTATTRTTTTTMMTSPANNTKGGNDIPRSGNQITRGTNKNRKNHLSQTIKPYFYEGRFEGLKKQNYDKKMDQGQDGQHLVSNSEKKCTDQIPNSNSSYNYASSLSLWSRSVSSEFSTGQYNKKGGNNHYQLETNSGMVQLNCDKSLSRKETTSSKNERKISSDKRYIGNAMSQCQKQEELQFQIDTSMNGQDKSNNSNQIKKARTNAHFTGVYRPPDPGSKQSVKIEKVTTPPDVIVVNPANNSNISTSGVDGYYSGVSSLTLDIDLEQDTRINDRKINIEETKNNIDENLINEKYFHGYNSCTHETKYNNTLRKGLPKRVQEEEKLDIDTSTISSLSSTMVLPTYTLPSINTSTFGGNFKSDKSQSIMAITSAQSPMKDIQNSSNTIPIFDSFIPNKGNTNTTKTESNYIETGCRTDKIVVDSIINEVLRFHGQSLSQETIDAFQKIGEENSIQQSPNFVNEFFGEQGEQFKQKQDKEEQQYCQFREWRHQKEQLQGYFPEDFHGKVQEKEERVTQPRMHGFMCDTSKSNVSLPCLQRDKLDPIQEGSQEEEQQEEKEEKHRKITTTQFNQQYKHKKPGQSCRYQRDYGKDNVTGYQANNNPMPANNLLGEAQLLYGQNFSPNLINAWNSIVSSNCAV